MGTPADMFYLAYRLYLCLRHFDTRESEKGRIINGLIFLSKVQEHLSKAKKAVKLLDMLLTFISLK